MEGGLGGHTHSERGCRQSAADLAAGGRGSVSNHADAEDLVQEALARVLQHQDRIEDGMLEPYAISTARNLVARCGSKRTVSGATSTASSSPATRQLLTTPARGEDQEAMTQALQVFADRHTLLQVASRGGGPQPCSLAQERGPPPERWPPGWTGSAPGCAWSTCWRWRKNRRPIGAALCSSRLHPRPASAARGRRGTAPARVRHCARVSDPCWIGSRETGADRVCADADIVTARQAARELAAEAGFPAPR